MSAAEAASNGLLEYLAEPEDGSAVKVLSIIATFQLRYTQQKQKHSTGNMKRVLARAVGSKDEQKAGETRKRASSEPPKSTVTPEDLSTELAETFAKKLSCVREV